MQPTYPYFQPEPTYRKWWLACCAVLALPISIFCMITFIVSSDFLGMDERSPKAMMEGYALKPHVYRQLIPTLTRGIMAITPEDTKKSIAEGLHSTLWDMRLFAESVKLRHKDFRPIELEDERLYPFVIISLLDYLFLLGYAYMLWRLAREIFPDIFPMQVMVPLFGLLALPPFCGKYGYIYDFPLLFFTAWLMLLMLRERWIAYFVVFGVATFNKESTIYMLAVYLLNYYDEMPRKKWLSIAAVQVLIFLIVKLLLAMAYSNGGGVFLEYRGLYGHMRANLDGYSVYTLFGLVAALALFTFRWEDKPIILRCWLVVLPFMVVAWLLFGNRNEYRVFYDIFPALTLLGCHTLVTALQWDTSKNQRRR